MGGSGLVVAIAKLDGSACRDYKDENIGSMRHGVYLWKQQWKHGEGRIMEVNTKMTDATRVDLEWEHSLEGLMAWLGNVRVFVSCTYVLQIAATLAPMADWFLVRCTRFLAWEA